MTRDALIPYLGLCLAMAFAMAFYARWGWIRATRAEGIVAKERGRLALNFAVPVGLVCLGCAILSAYRLLVAT